MNRHQKLAKILNESTKAKATQTTASAGNRQTDPKVIEESDCGFWLRALDHDDVGDRTRNGQVPRERAGHSQSQPCRMRIGK